MEIVTGFQGKNHVTARQVSRLLRSTLGKGNYVLDTLDRLSAEVLTANTVRIGTGDLIADGTWFANEAPEELTIENGVTGLNRNDIVVCQYTKAEPAVDEDGHVDYTVPRIEDGDLAVVKGTPSSGEPSDPELQTASIYDENTNLSQIPLYRLPITGLSVGEPEPLFARFTSAEEFRDSQSQSSSAALQDVANGSWRLSNLRIRQRSGIAQVTGQLSYPYTSSAGDYVDLLKDERIPAPLGGAYVYQATSAGTLAINGGVMRVSRVGGTVGQTAAFSVTYLV